MTKDKALQAWFSQFLDAYPASSVPDDVMFPYLTYELITGSFDSGEIGLTVNLWFYTESEAVPNVKAQEMADTIGAGGAVIKCDGGYIWIKRGSPWCQNIAEEDEPNLKRRYINITVEYLTEN